MRRPQRNPNRNYPKGLEHTRSVTFNGVRLVNFPGTDIPIDGGAAARQAAEQAAQRTAEQAAEPSPESQDTSPESQEASPESQEASPESQEASPESQETSPGSQEASHEPPKTSPEPGETFLTPRDELALIAALKAQILGSVENGPGLNQTALPLRDPRPPPPKSKPADNEESLGTQKSLSDAASSSIPFAVRVLPFERRQQPIFIRGLDEWEPLVAVVDGFSKTSLLDLDTANRLGLVLDSIPWPSPMMVASSKSVYQPELYAIDIGLRSIHTGLHAIACSIMVAPITDEDADVIIGSQLLRRLESAGRQFQEEDRPNGGNFQMFDWGKGPGHGTESQLKHNELDMNDSENSVVLTPDDSSNDGQSLHSEPDQYFC